MPIGIFKIDKQVSKSIDKFVKYLYAVYFILTNNIILYIIMIERMIFMAKTTTTITIDSNIKAQAQELLADFGLDLSTAVNIFLRQTVYDHAIPFEITRNTPNEETRKAIENVRNGVGLSKSFHSVSELMEDLYTND